MTFGFACQKKLNMKANSSTMAFGLKQGQVFIADASFALIIILKICREKIAIFAQFLSNKTD